MNTSQELFAIFFAIFWGTSSSAWSRWKAFNYPFWDDRRVRDRIWLSLWWLTIFPIIYFLIVLAVLGYVYGSNPLTGKWWSLFDALSGWIAGILAGLSAFGFYRLWLSRIELSPADYYYHWHEGDARLWDRDPTLEELHLDRENSRHNCRAGMCYLVPGFLLLMIWILEQCWEPLYASSQINLCPWVLAIIPLGLVAFALADHFRSSGPQRKARDKTQRNDTAQNAARHQHDDG